MRLLDTDNNKSIKNLILYLTKTEAEELLDDLKMVLKKNEKGNHAHITDLEYQHELTVTIYDAKVLDYFDERSKQIIQDDI